ncbi:MAG: glycosyltransferase [Candidatus Krumholzibacteriota bacterium]|nr:glycosyltransferase [Candidatus Krumholzibacteriota bacterium]
MLKRTEPKKIDRSKIRVLHIDAEKGWRGGQQQAVYLFEAMLREGYDSVFACKTGSVLADYLEERKLPHFTTAMRGEADLFSAFRIASFCRKHPINILHLHSAHAHSTGIAVKLFFPALKSIAVRRVDFRVGKNPLSRLKYSTGLVDRIVCISGEIKRVMTECGVAEEKLQVIRSGVDIHKFDGLTKNREIYRDFHIPEEHIIVGTVAAMAGHKDYPNLLRAARIVIDSRKSVTFVAVGAGSDIKEMKRLHGELGLGSRFIFAGYQEKVGPFLKLFDIFVLASKTEGLGTSLLDAQSIGLPIVATRTGGIPEIVNDGDTGILVPPRDHVALAEGILALIDNESRRRKLGLNGLRSVREFDIAKTVEQNISLYKELLGEKG